MKMRDAKARRDWWEYWVHFEFAIQLVLSYLEPRAAADVQKDFDAMDAKIQSLMKSDLNESTKEILINKLRAEFSDRHRYYVLKALNKIGIVKVAEEGVVDFDSTEIDTLTKIIRQPHQSPTGAGLQTLIDGAPGSPVPDLTLVYAPGASAAGRVLRMGSDDYKKYVDDKIEEKIAEENKPRAFPGGAVITVEDIKAAADAEKTRMERSASEKVPGMPNAPDDIPPPQFKLKIGHVPSNDEEDGNVEVNENEV